MKVNYKKSRTQARKDLDMIISFDYPDMQTLKDDLNNFKNDLLSTIPKQEDCEHIFRYDDDEKTTAVVRTCIKCGEIEKDISERIKPTPSPLDKLEDIEELKATVNYIDNYGSSNGVNYPNNRQITEKLNSLLRNQKIIIQYLTNKKG